MGLPVLRLPSLVFDNIYQFLDVSDKIVLSQCSRRVQDLVSSQEGPRTGRQVTINLYGHHAEVQIVRKTKDLEFDYLLRWKIYSQLEGNYESASSQALLDFKVDGAIWNVRRENLGAWNKEWYWYTVSEEGSFEKDILTLVKMLRNLFNCSISSICSYNGCMHTEAGFQKLFIETDALHRADIISLDEQRFAPKDIDFMFDHFVTDSLCFRGYGGPEYSYRKPLSFPKIYLNHATWINCEKLLKMAKASRDISLLGAKLISDIDINQFIKWWLASDNKTLEYLKIARGHVSFTIAQLPQFPEVPMEIPVIFEGIPSTPERKKNYKAIPRRLLLRLSRSAGQEFEIIRRDGVHATIVVTRIRGFDDFAFYAWHNTNPYVITN